jgi:hypothetical protein
MNCFKIGLDSPTKWNKALQGICHCFCHKWEYNMAMSISTGLNIFLHVFEEKNEKAIVALCERKKEVGVSELVSPYGFGGFSGTPDLLSSKRFKDAFIEFGVQQGYVTAYILQNPLIKLPHDYWSDYLDCHHLTYKIDLTNSIADIWNSMSKSHRYEIRRFDKNQNQKLTFDSSILSNSVKNLYRLTLKRLDAADVYSFPDDALDAINNSANALLIGVEDKNGIQAVSIFLHTEFIAEYFLNATTLHGRKYTRKILWTAIEKLKKMNIKNLHLGGGVKPRDSLDDFKRRFGGKALEGQALKIIFNQDTFNALCEKYCGYSYFVDHYFPPYWSKNAKEAPMEM